MTFKLGYVWWRVVVDAKKPVLGDAVHVGRDRQERRRQELRLALPHPECAHNMRDGDVGERTGEDRREKRRKRCSRRKPARGDAKRWQVGRGCDSGHGLMRFYKTEGETIGRTGPFRQCETVSVRVCCCAKALIRRCIDP